MNDSHQRYIAVHYGDLLTSKKHFQLYRLSGTVPRVLLENLQTSNAYDCGLQRQYLIDVI